MRVDRRICGKIVAVFWMDLAEEMLTLARRVE